MNRPAKQRASIREKIHPAGAGQVLQSEAAVHHIIEAGVEVTAGAVHRTGRIHAAGADSNNGRISHK